MITAKDNEKIKILKKLIGKKSFRDEMGLFVLEGERAVRDALALGAEIESIFLREGTDLSFLGDAPVYEVSKSVFDSVADTMTPQGVIATAKMNSSTLADLRDGAVIFCENLSDPGNLGTIIRTAAAVGAGGVILSEGCVDLYNPKVVRATMSSLFLVPIMKGAKVKETFGELKELGYRIFGTALREDSLDLYEETLPQKSVLVIGNEGNGMSEDALALCDKTLIIPMPGGAESLNASVAASVLLYEHLRQNRK